MKLFSVEEANALLPTVRLLIGDVQRAYRQLKKYHAIVQQAREGADLGGGGIPGGSRYLSLLMRFVDLSSEISSLGVLIKDFGRGLIDFPSLRDGKVVLLCWQMGEGDSLEWWHDPEAGFAGRRPI